jgi:DNA-binding PadR family transcriptional regulator
MGVILRELSREPIGRTALQERVERKGVTRATFDAVFEFLVRDRSIEKSRPEHKAPFRITEKGLKFLAWRGIA